MIATQALALLCSALAALAVGGWLGLGDGGAEGLALILGPWLFALLFVGAWRVRRHLRPYSLGARLALMWESMYQVQAALLALATALFVGDWLQEVARVRVLATALEGMAEPAGVLGGTALGLALFLTLRAVPGLLLEMRLKGRLSATAVGESIALAGVWVPVLALFVLLDRLGASIGLIDPRPVVASLWALGQYLAVAVAATLGYALPRLWLTRPSRSGIDHRRRIDYALPRPGQTRPRSSADPGLWIVLPKPEAIPQWQRLLDRVAAGQPGGPVTVVTPATALPAGEHAHLADRLGVLEALFPRLEIEVRDWRRALPPAEFWPGVGQRQIHPPPELMPLVLDRHMGALDRVLLIAGAGDDLRVWHGRLPVDRTRVARPAGDRDKGATLERPAGYPLVLVDMEGRGILPVDTLFAAEDKQPATVEHRIMEREGAEAKGREDSRESSTLATEATVAERRVDNGQFHGESVVESSFNEGTFGGETSATAHRPRVFISYARPYALYVRLLDARLRPRVALAYDMDLRAGDAWRDELTRMLRESDAVIAVVGAETAARDFPLAEIRLALETGKRLIPVFVDRFEEPRAVLEYMAANVDERGEIQWLADFEGGALERVMETTSANILAALEREGPRPAGKRAASESVRVHK